MGAAKRLRAGRYGEGKQFVITHLFMKYRAGRDFNSINYQIFDLVAKEKSSVSIKANSC